MLRSILTAILLWVAVATPAFARPNVVRMSVAASDSYSTTYSCEASQRVSGTDSRSVDYYSQVYLLRLEGTVTSVVGATSVTWYLAKDSAGEKPITDEATSTILDPDADNSGGVVSLINTGWTRDDDSTAGVIYVCGKTDAGTLSIVNRVFWEER